MDEVRHQVNLLDLVGFFIRWRRFLIAFTVTVTVIVAVISFVLPPKYRSTAIVRPAEAQQEGLGGLIASKLSALGGITGFGVGTMETPSEFFIQILKSRWMSERLIRQFDLAKVYKLQDRPIEDVIEAAKSHTRFELDPESQSVFIYAEDHNPQRAKNMAEYLINEVDMRHQDLKSYGARREREFIEQRLVDSRNQLAALEDSLMHFQISSGILNPEEQVKATIQAAATIEAQRLLAKTELEMKSAILGNENSETQYLRFRLASIDSTMRALVDGKQNENNAFMLGLKDTPEQALIYLRLMRDIEIQQILVGFLIQRFEQARLEEHRNTPGLMRIDDPIVPSVRVWPRRGLMTVVAAFAALIFGSAYGMVADALSRAKSDTSHPNHARLAAIMESWRGKSK